MRFSKSEDNRLKPKYTDNEVIGISNILVFGPYSESINIVIEEIPISKFRDNKLNDLGI